MKRHQTAKVHLRPSFFRWSSKTDCRSRWAAAIRDPIGLRRCGLKTRAAPHKSSAAAHPLGTGVAFMHRTGKGRARCRTDRCGAPIRRRIRPHRIGPAAPRFYRAVHSREAPGSASSGCARSLPRIVLVREPETAFRDVASAQGDGRDQPAVIRLASMGGAAEAVEPLRIGIGAESERRRRPDSGLGEPGQNEGR